MCRNTVVTPHRYDHISVFTFLVTKEEYEIMTARGTQTQHDAAKRCVQQCLRWRKHKTHCSSSAQIKEPKKNKQPKNVCNTTGFKPTECTQACLIKRKSNYIHVLALVQCSSWDCCRISQTKHGSVFGRKRRQASEAVVFDSLRFTLATNPVFLEHVFKNPSETRATKPGTGVSKQAQETSFRPRGLQPHKPGLGLSAKLGLSE